MEQLLESMINLLAAMETGLAFIERQKDHVTDPDSDVGAQIPNEACRVWAEMDEAYQVACTEYDCAHAEHEEWKNSYEAKRRQREEARAEAAEREHDAP